jgi:hypothetical protein
MVKDDNKLEKPTRSSIARLIDGALKEREALELSRFDSLSKEWLHDFVSAQESVMHELGLDVSVRNFEAKWKKFTGRSVYGLDDRPEKGSIVYNKIIELIGECPKLNADYDRKKNKQVFPDLEREASYIRAKIMSIEDMSVADAMKLIEDLRTGK